MDSIFPFIDPEIVEEPLPVAREWAFDTDKLDFKLKGGRMYQVEGKEAVKSLSYTLIVLKLKISYDNEGHVQTLTAGVVIRVEKIEKQAFGIVVID